MSKFEYSNFRQGEHNTRSKIHNTRSKIVSSTVCFVLLVGLVLLFEQGVQENVITICFVTVLVQSLVVELTLGFRFDSLRGPVSLLWITWMTSQSQ